MAGNPVPVARRLVLRSLFRSDDHYRLRLPIVGVDREACCLLKEALDRYLPDDYSKVVMSLGGLRLTL